MSAEDIAVIGGGSYGTCLAVLFVPSFFTVLQRFEERGKAKKKGKTTSPPPAEGVAAAGD